MFFIGTSCTNPLGSLSTDSNHFPSTEVEEETPTEENNNSGGEENTEVVVTPDPVTPPATPAPVVLPTPPIASGLVAWYGARFITGKNNGDKISTWEDQSGNGNDATQGTVGFQPTFVSSGFNSEPSLLFGSGSALTELRTPSFTLTERTIFIALEVLGPAPVTSGPVFLQLDTVLTNHDALAERTKYQMSYPPGSLATGTFAASGVQIISFVVGSSDVTVFVDGAQDMTDSKFAQQTVGIFQIGGDNAGGEVLNGEIAEIMIYNRELSPAEVQSVEAYLNGIYAAF